MIYKDVNSCHRAAIFAVRPMYGGEISYIDLLKSIELQLEVKINSTHLGVLILV